MQKILTPLAIIIAGFLIALSNLYVSGKLPFNLSGKSASSGKEISKSAPVVSPSVGDSQAQPSKDIPVGNSPFLGKSDAPVTVIEFSDYQCPYCAAVFGIAGNSLKSAQDPNWEPVVPNLQKDYVDKGLVKFVYKDFAFLGDESIAAANAALCAGDQGKYWQYHDKLFNSQNGENNGAFKDANLVSFGNLLGLNSEKFNKCVTGREHLAEVQETTNELRAYGSQTGQRLGTPAFFVNGKIIPGGAVPYTVVKSAIEAELKK